MRIISLLLLAQGIFGQSYPTTPGYDNNVVDTRFINATSSGSITANTLLAPAAGYVSTAAATATGCSPWVAQQTVSTATLLQMQVSGKAIVTCDSAGCAAGDEAGCSTLAGGDVADLGAGPPTSISSALKIIGKFATSASGGNPVVVYLGSDNINGSKAPAALPASATFSGGTVPTATCGTGAGTGAVCSLSSNATNNSGSVTVQTGTSPATASGIVTITFSGGGFATTPTCSIGAYNGNSAALSIASQPYVNSANVSMTSFVIASSSTALTASISSPYYQWSYLCR
jgi:hypothetical protein